MPNARQLMLTTGKLGLFLALVAGVAYAGASFGASAGPSTTDVAPSIVPYQGSITDTSDEPLNGTFDMTFSLYDAPSGGVPLWSESHVGPNAVPVSDGLFSVGLGSINPIDTNTLLAGPVYLGTTVEPDPEMTPRQVVGSVPYALVANTVPDASVSQSKIASGAVGSDELLDGGVNTQDIALNAASEVHVITNWWPGSTQYDTTSTSWVPIGSFSASFETDGGDLVVIGGPSKMLSSSGNAYYSISLDGAPPPATMCSHNLHSAWLSCMGFLHLKNVPAGSHTIRPMFQNNVGGTTSIGNYSSNSVIVLELKR